LYSIHPEDLKEAYDKGVVAAKKSRVSNQKDSYGSICFPERTLTVYLAKNPYTVTGSGNKLKSAWHNGFLDGLRKSC
tara:strand:+ start:1328 stop:1558 length:231 start_codon:yes stop_codon:yes gene_type:complete